MRLTIDLELLKGPFNRIAAEAVAHTIQRSDMHPIINYNLDEKQLSLFFGTYRTKGTTWPSPWI